MDGFSVVVIIQAMILRGVFIQHGKSHPFLPFFLSFFFEHVGEVKFEQL